LNQRFKVNFSFENESPLIDATLLVILTKILSKEGSMEVVPICSTHRNSMTVHELLECYNVVKEEHDEEDPSNVKVPEIEGEGVVEGPEIEYVSYTQPINTLKVNIGTIENPNFVQIGDYWNDETMENISDLLRKYQDLFPTTFSEIKGIVGEIGKMKIPLKPCAKLVRQRSYRLNLKYKEKVKSEIDGMLDTEIIEPVVELEWISPMVA
jgi:hypothetical protein